MNDSSAITFTEIRIAQGRLHEALAIYERSLQLAAEGGPQPAADLHVGISELYLERDALAAATQHEIRVQGHLDDRWADEMGGLTFTHEGDSTTTLTGPLADQAALHGVLNRLRDLGVPLVSLRRLAPPSEGAPQ